MKLTDIDLNDKSEVSAAHALLAAILGHAVSDDIPGAPSLNQTTGGIIPAPILGQPPTASLSQDAAAVFAQPGQLPDGAQPLQDAAAVFGGQQSATPLPGATGLPATSAQTMASLPSSNGGTSVAPGVGGQLPQAFVSNEGAAVGLPAGVGVELDSKGLPWDGRIHASTKSKKKDGSWTALRGLNDAAKVAAIEAELRATVQGQQLGAIVQAQGATPLPGLPVSGTASALPSGGALTPSSGPASGQLAPAADPVTFEQLMPRVTQATISGILPPTALQQVCGALGLPSVVALQTNPAFVPHAWAQLKAAYPALL